MWRSARTAGSGKGGAASLLASWRVPGFLARYGWRVFQPWFPECEQEECRGPGLAWLVPYSGCGVARLQPFGLGAEMRSSGHLDGHRVVQVLSPAPWQPGLWVLSDMPRSQEQS